MACFGKFDIFGRLRRGESSFAPAFRIAEELNRGHTWTEMYGSFEVLSELGVFQAGFFERFFYMIGMLPISLRAGAFVGFLKNLDIHQQEYPITRADAFKALDVWNGGKEVRDQIPSVLERVILSAREESEDALRKKKEAAKVEAEKKREKAERHAQLVMEAPGKLKGVINAMVENYYVMEMAPPWVRQMGIGRMNRIRDKAFRLNPHLRTLVISDIEDEYNFDRMFRAEYPGKSFTVHCKERLESDGEPEDWVKAEILKRANAKLFIKISASSAAAALVVANRKRMRDVDSSSGESSAASDSDDEAYPAAMKPFVHELQARLPRAETQGFGWDIRKKVKAATRAAANAAAVIVHGGAAMVIDLAGIDD